MTSKEPLPLCGQCMAIHVLVISSYRGPRTFRMAMQLVHLVIPFLINLNFPSLKKQVLMQTMQR